MANGFRAGASYTISKSMDNASSLGAGSSMFGEESIGVPIV